MAATTRSAIEEIREDVTIRLGQIEQDYTERKRKLIEWMTASDAPVRRNTSELMGLARAEAAYALVETARAATVESLDAEDPPHWQAENLAAALRKEADKIQRDVMSGQSIGSFSTNPMDNAVREAGLAARLEVFRALDGLAKQALRTIAAAKKAGQ